MPIYDDFMRLTSFTDFGLRALMRLAGELGRLFTAAEIADEFGISREHLTKVVSELARAGFVRTRRGAAGGFQLALEADRIRIGDVVRRLEGRQALVECFQEGGGGCRLTPCCSLKGKLAAAREAFLDELNRSTLAECLYRPLTGRSAA